MEIAKRVDPAVTAIISGHSHQGYNCLVPDPKGNDRIVIQGDFYGHLLQRLDLTVDKANHKVVKASAQIWWWTTRPAKANNTLNLAMTATGDHRRCQDHCC